MFGNALEFLEIEREAWRTFEALDALSDAELELALEAVHGWSGRDLMAHLLAWQAVALEVARELAVGESSPTIARVDADWETRGGEAVNAEIQSSWVALPLAEVRRRFREQPGELRGTLTVVPESRWIKHPSHMKSIVDETLDHYDDHAADLEAVLGGAAASRVEPA